MRKQLLLLVVCSLFYSLGVLAQTITVQGRVTDDKGAGLAGASVQEKGTKNGVSAANDGTFSIKVKSGAKLLISELGFETKEVNAVSGIVVQLATDTKALAEVVVTGTGVATSKKKVAIAVESINADKLPNAPTADIGNALVGKIAGAQISSTNGSPGSPTNILLRGINSILGGTRPMILLDGVEVAATGLESLDLNNVERVEVVQGPAAAGIYGAQGANGVIQLFSKKGKAGRVNIDFSTNMGTNTLLNVGGVQKARKHGFRVNAAGEVVRNAAGAPLTFDPVTGSYLGNPIINLISDTAKYNQSYGRNLQWYDHYDMFFQSANTYNNSLSINGSKDKVDFSIIASDNRQETVFKNNGNFSRTNFSANIGIELFKGLRLRSTTQLVNTVSTQLDPTGRNMLFAINNSRPFANYEQKDAAGFHSPYFGDAVGVNGYNFNYIIENAKAKDKTLDVVQSFNLNYKPTKFLEIDAKYGLNRSALNSRYQIAEQSHSEGAAYWEYWAEYYSPRTSYASPTQSSESGEINQGDYVTTFQNFNANIFARFSFKDDFKVNIPLTSSTQVGWDYRKRDYSELVSWGSDAPIITPYTARDMVNFKIASDYTEAFSTYGYLVNQRFDYGDYGGFSVGFRSDYSSAFGQGSKPFTFPRADAYLRLSSFNFFQKSGISNVVTEWKLRGAYGAAGIQPGAYDRFPVLTPATVGGGTALATPVTNANSALNIEVSKETEIGTDIALKLGKGNWLKTANLSFTYWVRKSEDVIDRVDVAPSLGVGRLLTNAMSLRSNGIQASLNLNVVSTKNWNWNFITNFSKQVSKVDKVLLDAEIIKQSAAGSSQYIIRAGERIGQLYGYLMLNSVDQRDPSGNFFIPQTSHGDYEVASNGYVVNKTTKQPFLSTGRYSLGDPNPKFNMSFINEVTFKNFVSFSMQWDWLEGSNLYNQTKGWMYRDGIHQDYDKEITINGQTQAWTAFYRGVYAARQANGTKSYFMEDASFLRLRNIALSFDVAKFVTIKGINRLQVVLTGRNLVTFTKYTGYDPEVSSGTVNSAWDRGVDHNTIPNVKTYQVGLNVGF
ncbi:MAG: SusC/RagA family TonB-linked outer membrane protein [Bacteroidetes bacterium]|nr:MAG: SusC/RagA family TonB-linked outer membrane protein [Bacteroidota bacterium]TAE72083.1 MAG: SusC/RagA family TonB-linked outer membrane protein [Bacteroidota bacterium]TAF93240.1 MAG: SusC/RagA family TonB-linked outer membrane protein [Bacteroidota bacterium]